MDVFVIVFDCLCSYMDIFYLTSDQLLTSPVATADRPWLEMTAVCCTFVHKGPCAFLCACGCMWVCVYSALNHSLNL